MNNDVKNKQIAQTMKNTITRHSQMDCRTFEIKVVDNKLNRLQKESINGIFREAKWLRNAYLNNKDDVSSKVKIVPVKVGDTYEQRELIYLGSQIKQSVIKQVKSEIKGLSTHKKKGDKIGKLKFKSYCNSINLKQYGTTYSINFDNDRIKVQNIKKSLYVRGLKQIPNDCEITNAKFVRKASGLYFYITCFMPKEEKIKTNKQIGIDFGIEHNLTLSNGEKFDIKIKESDYIKRKSRKINRLWAKEHKHSNNNKKRIQQLKIAYQKQTNKKKDKANKINNHILNSFDFIAMQDEMISNWHKGLFGKQVQNSAMGLIKAGLKNSSKTYVVDKSFPSTQICPKCGCLTKHTLEKREYHCEHCGYFHPSRDIKSAQSILDEALKQVSMEHRTQSLGEIEPSTSLDSSNIGKVCVMTQEAQVL